MENFYVLENIDDFELIMNKSMKRQRVIKDRFNPYENYDEISFIRRYRLSKGCFVELLNLIKSDLDNKVENSANIPLLIKLAIVLRFYATGHFQITEGDLDGIHQSTVSRLIKSVSIAIAKLKPQFITFPTIVERNEIKTAFYNKTKMPVSFWFN